MSDIVFCGVNDWRGIKQRPQHLAERLAVTNRILYVNPISYSFATHIVRKVHSSTQRSWRSSLETLAEHLWLFTPSPALPFSRRARGINRLNQRWLAVQLHPLLRRLHISAPLLWLSFPTDVDLIGHLQEQQVIFDCMDNYPGFFSGREHTVITAMELDLLHRADLVLTTAQPLLEKCRRINANTHLVPNGVDATHFARARAGLAEADDLHVCSRPRFGYIGTIGPWTDVDSMMALARAAPNGSVIVIGPWEIPQPTELPSNMYILGARPYTRLPEYLAGFDVALIPFKRGPLTQAVNPVKLFEYAAAGVPIVATATAELTRYAAWCILADSPQAWVDLAIRTAQTGETAALRLQAANEAMANDWQQRVETILHLIAIE
ncbi:MAG TPA: glycosyltransferase [Anaerolineae bacterium]|nr:glycosyltransferase [Anaerolineae bacterium]HQH37336.1 glycosyltransferase [Anaerolineae bacterium]